MYLNEIIEVVIGLSVIFFTVSLACSGIQEGISNFLKWRADGLEQAVRAMLQEPGEPSAIKLIEQHPLVQSLTPVFNPKSRYQRWLNSGQLLLKRLRIPVGNSNWPSYLPAHTFSLVLFDIVSTAGTNKSVIQAYLQKLKDQIKEVDTVSEADFNLLLEKVNSMVETGLIENPEAVKLLSEVRAFAAAYLPTETILEFERSLTYATFQAGLAAIREKDYALHQSLNSLVNQASAEITGTEIRLSKTKENIEKWFNDTMDRASGWYKRQTIIAMFIIGLVLSISFNLDSIQIADALWRQPTLRAALIAQSEKITLPQSQVSTLQEQEDSLKQFQGTIYQLAKINVPLGWPIPVLNLNQAILKALGWIITAAAAAQGAPFWFDLIMKLTNLRLAGKKPSTSNET
jgi:hypothetical protein